MEIKIKKCIYPDCKDDADHEHHIFGSDNFDPEKRKKTEWLCKRHHEDITILNGKEGRRVRHSLSDRHREFIWDKWINGEMKPRRTKKALEYVRDWNKMIN